MGAFLMAVCATGVRGDAADQDWLPPDQLPPAGAGTNITTCTHSPPLYTLTSYPVQVLTAPGPVTSLALAAASPDTATVTWVRPGTGQDTRGHSPLRAYNFTITATEPAK